ncbi:hypothetical protein GCM10010331_26510 [Streptomyces xanthochromogenes]|nr:hypothetical protein GCM10010331_26510 [Streptomyces xanthochromogenes]
MIGNRDPYEDNRTERERPVAAGDETQQDRASLRCLVTGATGYIGGRCRLLRLRAEMRLPGLAWLEMSLEAKGPGRSRYRQRAVFHPRGLLGHAYWWSVSPFHAIVFGGMARNMAKAAEAESGRSSQVRGAGA